MESSKIEVFMKQYQDKFASDYYSLIRAELSKLPDERMARISRANFKSPIIALLLALFLGLFGAGAFYANKIGFGILQICSNILIGIFSILSIVIIAMVIGDSSNWLLCVVFYITYVGLIIEALVLFVASVIKARKWTYEYNLYKLNEAMTSL